MESHSKFHGSSHHQPSCWFFPCFAWWNPNMVVRSPSCSMFKLAIIGYIFHRIPIKHPIVVCVIMLSEKSGGSMFESILRVHHTDLESMGWLYHHHIRLPKYTIAIIILPLCTIHRWSINSMLIQLRMKPLKYITIISPNIFYFHNCSFHHFWW